MLFTEAYSGPVCAPSRTTLIQGLHNGHTHIRGNDGAYTPLPAGGATIATVIKAGGYQTVLQGKWGLGNFTTSGYPLAQGFDIFHGYDNQVACHQWYPSELYLNTASSSIPANEDHCKV